MRFRICVRAARFMFATRMPRRGAKRAHNASQKALSREKCACRRCRGVSPEPCPPRPSPAQAVIRSSKCQHHILTRSRVMWTMTARCAAVRCGSFLRRRRVRSSARPMGWARAAPTVDLGWLNFWQLKFLPLLRLFVCFLRECIWLFAKAELVVTLENPAARNLVDGHLTNWLTPTHTHENRYPHPYRGFRRP
jgi:hypothetical protein